MTPLYRTCWVCGEQHERGMSCEVARRLRHREQWIGALLGSMIGGALFLGVVYFFLWVTR